MPLVRKPSVPRPAAAAQSTDVLRALASTSADERWAAARAAANLPGAAEALGAALRTETEAHVREALFGALARSAPPQSTEQLVALLRSDQSALRTGALDALRSLGSAVSSVLPQLLADPDADVRLLSCELVRALEGTQATRLLCTLLAHESETNVCAAAVEVLAELGTPEAAPALAQCAQRFSDNAFLGFAIKIASERITSQPLPARE